MIGEVERQCRVLLDQQHRDPLFVDSAAGYAKSSATISGARPKDGSSSSISRGRSIRARPIAEHLLLAAAQGAGLLAAPFSEPREQLGRDRSTSAAIAAWSRLDMAPSRRFSSTVMRTKVPRPSARALYRGARCPRWRGRRSACRRTGCHRSSVPCRTAPQRRRLAGAVGAEQGHDGSSRAEIEPCSIGSAVKGARSAHLEHHRRDDLSPSG